MSWRLSWVSRRDGCSLETAATTDAQHRLESKRIERNVLETELSDKALGKCAEYQRLEQEIQEREK